MKVLIDHFGRKIDYLRISVTPYCNLRCFYCLPSKRKALAQRKTLLNTTQVIQLSRIACGLGIRKIRLTGGEPLLRKDLTDLIEALSEIPELEDLSITTNGILLASKLEELKRAGLKRVNISLDSLQPDKYKKITGGDLASVSSGIQKAKLLNLPVKINTVVLRGVNEGEIFDFLRFCEQNDFEQRFIEFMPLCGSIWKEEFFVSADELLGRISEKIALTPLPSSGSATRFRFGVRGTVGFIRSLSHPFCSDCSRLRLTYWGSLKPCLFSSREIDIFSLFQGDDYTQQFEEAFAEAVSMKPKTNPCLSGEESSETLLIREIGG